VQAIIIAGIALYGSSFIIFHGAMALRGSVIAKYRVREFCPNSVAEISVGIFGESSAMLLMVAYAV